MNIEFIKKISVDSSCTILAALQKMDSLRRKLLIVTERDKYKSLLSIGDIQRAIIANISLDNPLCSILRPSVNVASVNEDINKVKENMRKNRNEFMPILDDYGNVCDIILWEDLFKEGLKETITFFDLPVVIMAGGQGSRLRPLTNILPKPLIPIGKQTMMEDIIDKFVYCGCKNFYLSVNYKADVIKRYFDAISNRKYNIQYFQEEKPLGTAGSLHLLKDKIRSTFFVSNCDIIIDESYDEILNYHRENHNEITVVAAVKNISIPYGTLETKEEGLLFSLQEKPNYTFKINTGFYILEPNLLKEIPENEFYHITDLIEKLCKEGRRVGVYPVKETSWTDIGNWEEYMKYIDK